MAPIVVLTRCSVLGRMHEMADYVMSGEDQLSVDPDARITASVCPQPRCSGKHCGRLLPPRSTGCRPCRLGIPQREDQPPSEAMVWPVTHSASSLTSQAIRLAVSTGVDQRPPGERSASAAMAPGSA